MTDTALTFSTAVNVDAADTRLPGVDALRGIAILAVVCNHSPHYALGGFRENPWFFPALAMDFGYLGVPLFVVISGFCIHRRAAIRKLNGDCKPPNWIEFWKRRFWRLYPPYLGAIAVSVVCQSMVSQKPLLQTFDVADLTTHLLLLHNLTADHAGGLGNAAFWSLGMEEQLYLLYIPLVFLCMRGSMGFAVLIAACTAVGWRILVGSGTLPASFHGLGAWSLWPFSFWMHWALGALAAEACFGVFRPPNWYLSRSLAVASVVMGVAANLLTVRFLSQTKYGQRIELDWQDPAFAFVSHVAELFFGVAFFIFLNRILQPRHEEKGSSFIARPLASVGKISYSVYLVHLPVINLIGKCCPLDHSVVNWPIRLTLCVGASLLAGIAFYLGVERWFLTRPSSRSGTAAPTNRSAIMKPGT